MRKSIIDQAAALSKLRFMKQQGETIGKVPGELVFVGNQKQEFVRISVIAYNEGTFLEKELEELPLAELNTLKEHYSVVWINIDGLHDAEKIVSIGQLISIPDLLLEDIVHTGQRPKFNQTKEAIFYILKMLRLDKSQQIIEAEQLSVYQSDNVLFSFQEKVGDVFEPVRERIRQKSGRVRNVGVDYLSYCLADSVIDSYILIMQHFGEKIENLEDQIILEPNSQVLGQINRYKIELNYFRKAIRPAREAVANWKKSDFQGIAEETRPFLEDLNELTERAFYSVENYKSMLTEQLTVYSTNVNNKLNDIMKVLTIFSALFIPLTFIAGIYGTNFEYFPELKFKYSYFVMWGVMLTVAILMLFYFKRKRWF